MRPSFLVSRCNSSPGARAGNARLGRAESIALRPSLAQDLCHRCVRHAELPRDRWRAHPLSPQPFDLAGAQLAHGLLADAEIARYFDGFLIAADSASHQESNCKVWCAHSLGCSPGASARV
jgi:hypothetical protein